MIYIGKTIKYYLFTASANIVLIFSSGAIIQSFLSSLGISADKIGIYTLSISIMQIITLLLSVFITDKIKNIPKAISRLTLPALIFFSVMIFLSLNRNLGENTVFISAIAVCCFWNFFYGLRIVIEYKLPYCITDISEYPRISNISGIILSILGITVSSLLVLFSRIFDYYAVMCVSFIISVIFTLIATFTAYSLRNESPADPAERSNAISLDCLTMSQTRYLAVPNVLRGIGNGIMGMAAVIMLSTVTENKSVSSSIAAISAAAVILSCFLYSRIYKRVKTATLILIGGMVQFSALLFLFCGKSAAFLIFYFIAFMGENIVDYAVPVFVTEIVPFDKIGGYTSIRMLLFTLGVAIGNFIAGRLASSTPQLLIYICGAAQLINVLCYYLYYKKTGGYRYESDD